MVVKLNDLRHQDAAGFTQKAPRWTIALKYPAEEAPSILLRLVSLVGPTGWFATPPNQLLLEDLKRLGFSLATGPETRLAGHTFVLTGSLPCLSRSAAQP